MENLKIDNKAIFKEGENEIKESLSRLWDKNNAIEDALNKLDKADIVLQHWTQEYSYSERPNPRAAIDWWNGIDESRAANQSAAWFREYNYIFEFIQIAFDYIIESKKILEEGLKSEKKQAG